MQEDPDAAGAGRSGKSDTPRVARERFVARQVLELDEMFALAAGESPARQKFEQLALETYDALASQGREYVPFHIFVIQPDSSLSPARNKRLLERLPLLLRQRWVEWEGDYKNLAEHNPKLALYDMLSWISETHDFTSWPSNWEHRIRDWVDADCLAPMPFDDRLEIITSEFYARLRQARAQCRGWLYWDGKTVKFLPDPDQK